MVGTAPTISPPTAVNASKGGLATTVKSVSPAYHASVTCVLFFILGLCIVYTSAAASSLILPLIVDANEGSVFANFCQPVTLECQASGNPQPSIVWYKDGKEIEGEGSQLLRLPEIDQL